MYIIYRIQHSSFHDILCGDPYSNGSKDPASGRLGRSVLWTRETSHLYTNFRSSFQSRYRTNGEVMTRIHMSCRSISRIYKTAAANAYKIAIAVLQQRSRFAIKTYRTIIYNLPC